MSDGPSDAAREARILQNVGDAVTCLREAFDEGGYDVAFGLNGSVVRELDALFQKAGYRLVHGIVHRGADDYRLAGLEARVRELERRWEALRSSLRYGLVVSKTGNVLDAVLDEMRELEGGP